MNKRPIEQAKNPLLRRVLPALERAALQARKIALQTGTSIIIMKDGHLQKIQSDGIRDMPADYQTGGSESD
jgi:hypothetical protein